MKKKYLLVFTLCCIFSSFLALYFIQEPKWDFFSYHFYNGWAFLNNRIDIDIMPTFYRSCFNPILDALNYLLITSLNNHPYLYNILINLNYALFLFLCYLIIDYIFIDKNKYKPIFVSFCMIFILFSPIIFTLQSIGYNDLCLAVIILLSIYLLIKTLNENLNLYIPIGLILGIITGLKYSEIIPILVIFICMNLIYKDSPKVKKGSCFLCLTAFIGIFLSGGVWFYTIWAKYQNPFFPYFNDFFNSKFAEHSDLLTYDFKHLRHSNFLNFIFAPVKSTLNVDNGYEFSFYDIKIPLTFISCVLLFFKKIKKQYDESLSEIVNLKIFNFILLFTILTYYFNLFIFGQLRYVGYLLPLCTVIITTAIYICSKNKILKYFIPLFIIILTPIHYIFAYIEKPILLGRTHLIIILAIFFVIACCLFFIHKISDYKKLTCVILAFTTVQLISSIYFVIPYFVPTPNKFKKILQIENMKIPDNSKVLLATMHSNFVVPYQNKKAQYIGFGIPPIYYKDFFWNIDEKYNRYYSNKYLQYKTNKALISDSNVYIIFTEKELGDNYYDLKLFEKSIGYYTKNKIKKLSNCKIIQYSFLSQPIANDSGSHFICKLK